MKADLNSAEKTADREFAAIGESSAGSGGTSKGKDPDPSLQLYLLAIIQLFGSEEEPISVSTIKTILAQYDPSLVFAPATLYSNLRTLWKVFLADKADFPETCFSGKWNPGSLRKLYGGTIHCYKKATLDQKKKGLPDFIEVKWDEQKDEKQNHYCYAFRGRFSEGEIEMLKASVIANQYLSADTTERLLRELNSIRGAAQSERAYKDEKYYASLHQDDKLGQVSDDFEELISPQRNEDFMSARISLLLKAIHDGRKVRMTYGSYTLEKIGSKSASGTVSGNTSGYVSGEATGKTSGNATGKAADASFDNLPHWRKKGYNLILQPDSSGTSLFSPFAVFCANGYYYLIAHAEGRGVYYRNYRIDRIVSLEMTEEKSEPMPEKLKKYATEGSSFNAVAYRNEHPVMFGGAPSYYKLRCHKKMLNNLVDAFGTRFGVYMNQDAEAEDSYLVYVYASEEGIISFCLQYGEYCQVLDAPQVEEKLCAKLDAIRAKYLKKI
ncbi:MAG: WYL domain-containing protein [Lachnospiraceae bacterium]|nr:WYL domain-containing protein [Lachnospiraceae bacterium]